MNGFRTITSDILRKPERLKRSHILFSYYLLVSKKIARDVLQILWPSHNIWTVIGIAYLAHRSASPDEYCNLIPMPLHGPEQVTV